MSSLYGTQDCCRVSLSVCYECFHVTLTPAMKICTNCSASYDPMPLLSLERRTLRSCLSPASINPIVHRRGCTAINGDGALTPGRVWGSIAVSPIDPTSLPLAVIPLINRSTGNRSPILMRNIRMEAISTVIDALVGLCVLEIPYVKSLSKSSD